MLPLNDSTSFESALNYRVIQNCQMGAITVARESVPFFLFIFGYFYSHLINLLIRIFLFTYAEIKDVDRNKNSFTSLPLIRISFLFTIGGSAHVSVSAYVSAYIPAYVSAYVPVYVSFRLWLTSLEVLNQTWLIKKNMNKTLTQIVRRRLHKVFFQNLCVRVLN